MIGSTPADVPDIIDVDPASLDKKAVNRAKAALKESINNYQAEKGTKKASYDVSVKVLPSDIENLQIVVTKKDSQEVFEKTPEGVYRLLPGDYTLKVTAEGYLEKAQDFTVTDKNQEKSEKGQER